MARKVTAVTPLIRSLQQWRIENGRDPNTGRRVRVNGHDHPLDAKILCVMALRSAENATAREDLRPQFAALREHIESMDL